MLLHFRIYKYFSFGLTRKLVNHIQNSVKYLRWGELFRALYKEWLKKSIAKEQLILLIKRNGYSNSDMVSS